MVVEEKSITQAAKLLLVYIQNKKAKPLHNELGFFIVLFEALLLKPSQSRLFFQTNTLTIKNGLAILFRSSFEETTKKWCKGGNIVAWILDWGEKCKPKLGKHFKNMQAGYKPSRYYFL